MPRSETTEGVKTNVQAPMTWRGLAVFTALGTVGLAYYSKERERRINGKIFSFPSHKPFEFRRNVERRIKRVSHSV